MIRVVVADDQAVVRGGLRMILESEVGIEVVGEAADGRQALDLVRKLDPDVVLMDIRMPTMDGMEATRRLITAGGRARVLVLTTYDLDENVYDALKAGAAGFLVKTDSPARLVQGVRVVAGGESLLTPDITRRLVRSLRHGSAAELARTAGARGPDRPRARGPQARGTRSVDRRSGVRERRDREDPRGPHPVQARTPRPRPGRRLRLRMRDRRARGAR